MNNVWYLAVVVVVSAGGVMGLWLRSRPASSPKSSIDQFNDKMKALSPEMAIKADGRQSAERRESADGQSAAADDRTGVN